MLSKRDEKEGLKSRLNKTKIIEVKRLLQHEGCPICRACDEYLERCLFWFFAEAYGEGVAVSRYIDRWGFCEKHTKMVAKSGPKWQKTVIYSWILNAKLPEIQVLHKLLEAYTESNFVKRIAVLKELKNTISKARPRGGCYFCETIAQTASSYVHSLLDALAYQEVQNLYRKSTGLCIPHFFQVLELFHENYVQQLKIIVEVQIEQLNGLKYDFDEFFRKEDYRFSHEPKDKEQFAWIRAIKLFMGNTCPED